MSGALTETPLALFFRFVRRIRCELHDERGKERSTTRVKGPGGGPAPLRLLVVDKTTRRPFPHRDRVCGERRRSLPRPSTTHFATKSWRGGGSIVSVPRHTGRQRTRTRPDPVSCCGSIYWGRMIPGENDEHLNPLDRHDRSKVPISDRIRFPR